MSELSTKLAPWSIPTTILASSAVISSVIASSPAIRGSGLSLIGCGWELGYCDIFGGMREFHEIFIEVNLGNNVIESHVNQVGRDSYAESRVSWAQATE